MVTERSVVLVSMDVVSVEVALAEVVSVSAVTTLSLTEVISVLIEIVVDSVGIEEG